ncbi:MAG: ribonuclease III [Lachnospiraceae bacterium]
MTMQERIAGLEERIEYVFQNKKQLQLALTHSSYANEQRKKQEYNERIEFLGDAVLELVMSDYLYRSYPEKKEGELTKMRASLVCERTLAGCARKIQLGDFLLLSKGEEQCGGRNRDSILSDAFESVIGAIYLDGGIEQARTFIMKHLLEDVEDKFLFYDAKTTLQELLQAEKKILPEYRLIGETGPEHDKTFEVEVLVEQTVIARGSGHSKKAAEQMAAYLALKNKEKK